MEWFDFMRSHGKFTASLVLALALPGAAVAHHPTHVPATSTVASPDADGVDENLWLEEVKGNEAQAWVAARNAETRTRYASSPRFSDDVAALRGMLDGAANTPRVTYMAGFYYNLGKDKDHPRGVWRRTTLDNLRKPATEWTAILDLDALSREEHENWVWHGAQCLPPAYNRCLVLLSRGGAYAQVVREFDVETRRFIADGFNVPESKGTVSWIDVNHVYVSTGFGAGSMTQAGYPRTARLWKRGTPLASATVVAEVPASDVSVDVTHDAAPGFTRDLVTKSHSFYETETFVRQPDGHLTKIDVPRDAVIDIKREWLLVQPRSPWHVAGRTFAPGTLLATRFDDYMAGKRELIELFTPDAHTSLVQFAWTRHHLILTTLHDVAGSVDVLTPNAVGPWEKVPLRGLPPFNTLRVVNLAPDENDDYLVYTQGFLTPGTLYHGTAGAGSPERVKQAPAAFDASRMEVTQHFARSKDGTQVPYFEVGLRDRPADGPRPTLISAYGGFELAMQPFYSPAVGMQWLERGGVYVIANARGGGEYGPAWHDAAVREHRPRVYEDVAAVARDLIARKVTSPAHLGIEGSSNGGLTAGNMLVSYPDLFGAAIVGSPLLDMKRYTHLAAGNSWIEEYGDPDQPADWAFIRTFSPYQLLRKGQRYPSALFATSSTDDTVGPAHARKMVARMRGMGLDASLYENVEGGHAGASNNEQAAFLDTLIYSYLWAHLD
jgi:prolyl oligopeptidase